MDAKPLCGSSLPSRLSTSALATEKVEGYLKTKIKHAQKQLHHRELSKILRQHSRGKQPKIIHCSTSDEQSNVLKMVPPNHRFLRRPAVSLSPSPSVSSFTRQQNMSSSKGPACTHLTMTRLYTSEFRCGVCLQISNLGWVYRCTQDEELRLENDAGNDKIKKIDAISDLFPPSSSPRKRSAAARESKLSFLDEISHDALKTYTPAQLSIVLNQRAHVLDVARESCARIVAGGPSYFTPQGLPATIPETPSKTPNNSPDKPWLPARGTECQFKCCHFCRPTLTERATLSLNGIANGDIPPTAIYGFGFHLHNNKRPVALVKYVRNLGLRPSPISRPESSVITPAQEVHNYLSQQIQGLGIFDLVVPEPQPLPALPADYPPPAAEAPQTSHINPINTFMNPSRSILLRRLENASIEVAVLTPLPEPTAEELESFVAPLTLMEMSEMKNGGFGSAPLDVSGGVAVTEEAVGLHVADLIT